MKLLFLLLKSEIRGFKFVIIEKYVQMLNYALIFAKNLID